MPEKTVPKRTETDQNGVFALPLSKPPWTEKIGPKRTKTDRTNQNGVFALPLNKLFISICFIRVYPFLSVFVRVQKKKEPKRTITDNYLWKANRVKF